MGATQKRREVLPSGIVRPQVFDVAMRDGVHLATDVYGIGAGKRPVLLERTPYGRRKSRASDQLGLGREIEPPATVAERFVSAGYIVVRQDCRGRGDSEGSFTKYFREGEDGADTMEWICRQPWCDGRVITMGVSYSAHTQAAAAAFTPPALAGMLMDSGGFASAYEAGMRMGGAFELKQATWAFKHARLSAAMSDPVARSALERSDISEWITAVPWQRGISPLSPAPEYESYLLEQWRHESFGDYWRHPAIYARGSYDDFPDVPTVHIGSWYDPYVNSTVENFAQLRARKNAPAWLVMGPWTHGARGVTYAGDVDFGESAAIDRGLGADYFELRRRWFDAMSGRTEDTAVGLAPVTYFCMGGGSGQRNADGRLSHGGRWASAEQWPPEGSTVTRFYLAKEGALSSQPGSAEMITYDFNPDDPVPTVGGQVTSGAPLMEGGAFDQTPDDRFFGAREPHLPLNARADVVTFRSQPLDRDVTIAGPVAANIQFSTSVVDTDLTIKLIDEYPPSADYPLGFAMNLTDGIFRCRFHESFEAPTALEPGKVYTVRIAATDTANTFAKGHVIRLDVSSSNFPRFDVNSNTGEATNHSRARNIARNTLYVGGDSGSFVELSVISTPGA